MIGADYTIAKVGNERAIRAGWPHFGAEWVSVNFLLSDTGARRRTPRSEGAAPVTNWRFYDSVYTERYMRTPKENPDGYDDNSPLSHAEKIKGNYLIIHGSADDNVHLQNTMEFTERMVQSGVQFDMAIYTNRNHGIRGGNTSMHLYTRMTNYLKEKLQ